MCSQALRMGMLRYGEDLARDRMLMVMAMGMVMTIVGVILRSDKVAANVRQAWRCGRRRGGRQGRESERRETRLV